MGYTYSKTKCVICGKRISMCGFAQGMHYRMHAREKGCVTCRRYPEMCGYTFKEGEKCKGWKHKL